MYSHGRWSTPNLPRAPPQQEHIDGGKGGQTPGSGRRPCVAMRRRRWGALAHGLTKGSHMPTNKDFKRVVRARMRKTGESYTAARATLTRTTKPAPTPAPDLAAKAGFSDAVLTAKTGCTWEKWVFVLDRVKAWEWPHGEITAYIREKYHVPGWWTQAVAVGYERIKGLRAKGQRLDGTYEANKSKTVAAPAPRAFRAWKDGRTRRRWLPEEVTVRTATASTSLRLRWEDGTTVAVWLTAKGRSKTAVAVSHMRLPDKATADRLKVFWAERLGALAAQLGE